MIDDAALPLVADAPAARGEMSLSTRLLLSLALLVMLWLPRGLQLDHFVAVDERSWLTRSGNFYLALTTGDWAATFQRYHPGVTTMWLGMLGFLGQYPGYPADVAGQITSMSGGIEDFLVAHGHAPIDLLAAGRSAVVLATVLLLVWAFWLAVDLLGFLPALTGIVLLGFEPMGLGLTRMLHVDGLSATLMLVSLLLFLRMRRTPSGRTRYQDLILSGALAGLAWLTKSPALMLAPFVVLVAGVDLLLGGRTPSQPPPRGGGADRSMTNDPFSLPQGGGVDLGSTSDQFPSSGGMVRGWFSAVLPPRERFLLWFRDLLIWGGVAGLVFVALWPAMWVQPVKSLRAILSAAGESAEIGHSKDIYFNGAVLSGDPGPLFYPISYLWHVTPVTLVGVAFALGALIAGARRRDPTWQGLAWLMVYAAAFTLFMNLGAKKFDRYLLPAYFPLALAAGVGWSALVVALGRVWGRWAIWLLPGALALHMGLILPHFPYYFTFYNPLLGGITAAPDVLMIGRGEGLDAAARYLNAKPNATKLRAAAWYRGGSFNYLFAGEDLDLEEFYRADYAVLYVHQWQRQVPTVRLLDYFSTLTPEYTVNLHGLDYAWVYNLEGVPPPAYFTDWAGAIRLVETQVLPARPVAPGDDLVVRLRLYTIGTVDTNLSAVVRLADAAGNEVARSEGWPYGSPTSTWQPDEVYVDGHEFTLPADLAPGYLRIELGFYDGDAQAPVPGMVAGTETPRGDFVSVGYLGVGLAGRAVTPLSTPPLLGGQIELLGATLQGSALADGNPPRVTVAAGEALPLLLGWNVVGVPRADYTTLLHLVDANGVPVQQWDRAPLQGVVPTTLWREHDPLLDAYHLDFAADLPPGEYRLLVGLYDLPTLTRLPVEIGGAPAGDTVLVATVVVE